MPKDPKEFISACARTGLLIDSNLLVLLAVGNKDKSSIVDDSRTSCYSEKDYDLLVKLVRLSNHKLLITPYIVSELSNHLVDAKKGNNKYYGIAKELIRAASESHYHKDTILNIPELNFLGFTDVSILRIVEKKGCAVVTNDLSLYSKLIDSGRNAAHLQTLAALGSSSF